MNGFYHKKRIIMILNRIKKFLLVLFIVLINLSFFLSFFPNIMGLSYTSSSVYSYGVIKNTNEIIYWSASFETGDFSEVDPGGRLAHNPPGTDVSVVTDPVYKGNYAMKANIEDPSTDVFGLGTTRAEIAKWKQTDNSKYLHDLQKAYYGVAIYLPSDFDIPSDSSSWHIIFQLHEAGNDSLGNRVRGIFTVLQVKNRGDLDVFYFQTQIDADHVKRWEDTNPVPLGRWFTVIVYLDASVNGVVKLWIDSDLKGEWYDNFSSKGYVGPHVQAGLYQDINDAANTVYIDNLVVASTYEKAKEFLG